MLQLACFAEHRHTFDFVFVPCHSDAASAVNATFHAFVDN